MCFGGKKFRVLEMVRLKSYCLEYLMIDLACFFLKLI